MVWELEGPMPTLKMSKTLKLMGPTRERARARARNSMGAHGSSLQRAPPAHMLCNDLRRLKCDPFHRRHAGLSATPGAGQRSGGLRYNPPYESAISRAAA